MKKRYLGWIILGSILLLFMGGLSDTTKSNKPTTLILVRHAEKIKDGSSNPALTPAGTLRANELAYVLKHVPLDVVYSTQYKRTLQTVKPVAREKGLEIKAYKPGEEKTFIEKILKTHPGETVLISGHSNTIPVLANILLGRQDFKDLEDNVYDNMFIISAPEGMAATVTRIRFGAHTPEK